MPRRHRRSRTIYGRIILQLFFFLENARDGAAYAAPYFLEVNLIFPGGKLEYLGLGLPEAVEVTEFVGGHGLFIEGELEGGFGFSFHSKLLLGEALVRL